MSVLVSRLKKRRTTIRPITFEMSVAEDDSSMRVSKDSVHDVPGSQVITFDHWDRKIREDTTKQPTVLNMIFAFTFNQFDLRSSSQMICEHAKNISNIMIRKSLSGK